MPIFACLRTGNNGLECVTNLGDGQFHIRCFLTVHDDQFLRATCFTAHPHISHPVYPLNQLFDLPGQEIRCFQIMPTNFQLHFLLACSSHAQNKESLAGPCTNRGPWNTAKFPPQSRGDLLAGAGSFRLGLEGDSHFTGMTACPAPCGAPYECGCVLGLGNLFPHHILYHIKGLLEYSQPGPHFHFQGNPHLSLVRLRHELGPYEGIEHKASKKDQQGTPQNHLAMTQSIVEDAFVRFLQCCEKSPARHENFSAPCILTSGIVFRRPENKRGEHGYEREGRGQRARESETDHIGQLFEHDPGHAAHKDHGQKDHQGGQRAGNNGGRDLLTPFNSCLVPRDTGLPQPENVLQHHNGIVHKHPHTQSQTAEGHHVQRETAEIHEGKGGDNRNGNGRADNRGAAYIPEKKEQNEKSQYAAIEYRRTYIADGSLDIIGRIDNRGHMNLRNILIDFLDLFEDAPRHVYGVHTRLFEHHHPDPWFAIDPRDPCDLLPGILHLRDVPDLDGHAFPNGDHGVAQFIQAGVFPGGTDHHIQISPLQSAGRDGHVFSPYFGKDLIQRKTQGFNLTGQQIHMDFSIQSPVHIHGSHTG